MMMMMKIVVPALLALASTPALAEEWSPALAVPHADLDLTAAEGRATFDRRIRDAVRHVCSTGPYSVAVMPMRWSCIRDTTARADASARVLIGKAERKAATELATR